MMGMKLRTRHGFTLVEMAVVLAVLSLLMAGLLGGVSAQREHRRLLETRNALEQAKEALIGYALANNRLPCPADPSLASTHADAGHEASRNASGNCTLLSGALPWADLGVQESDGWGRRFTYGASEKFSAKTTSCGSASQTPCFTLTTTADLKVSRAAGCSAANVANGVPAVIVSHGQRFAGSYGADGNQAPGATGDEAENSDGGSDKCFVSRAEEPDVYDDQTSWISASILLAKLVSAGKLSDSGASLASGSP